MERGVLSGPERIDELRRGLAGQRTLFEVRCADGEAEWSAVDGTAPFDWQAPLPLNGAKRFFFPAREAVLTWRHGDLQPVIPAPQPFVLFGLRACDLTAIAYQDRFFAADPWYARRRQRALLVGVNCLAACPGGFCRDVDAGPFAAAGAGGDIDVTLLPDRRVVVEVATARGREAIAAAGLELLPYDANAEAAWLAARARALASFTERPFIARAMQRISADTALRTSTELRQCGTACFACTGCTNVCPTCSCFTMVDERGDGGGGTRTRCWDSCLLEGFQREASGHHPAPDPAHRVYRFWYHKLADQFREQCGRVGCVGCGRCDVTCPGGIGALAVLRRVGGE